MPLAFSSTSHGTVAFGFFNIESHMLLLDRYFFFADAFCSRIGELTVNHTDAAIERNWTVFRIGDPAAIGDLMGAINGIRFTGFIGAVYRRFPFPPQPEDFKQNPDGDRTREIITAIIKNYGSSREISVIVDDLQKTVAFGDYCFDSNGFQALVRYVWQGGYPRWRDDRPPGYVHTMRSGVDQDPNHLFHGMNWD